MVRQPRWNTLLAGVDGTDMQSLTQMAMYSYNCFQIELMRGYNYESFQEDLKKITHIIPTHLFLHTPLSRTRGPFSPSPSAASPPPPQDHEAVQGEAHPHSSFEDLLQLLCVRTW